MINRREFVKGGLATLGFLALPGGLFAAPKGWKPAKKPNLVFGILSDTHMRCHYDGVRFYDHNGWCYGDHALVTMMKLFKKAGVDAILHCGDITDCGMVRELEFYNEAWDKVYGSGPRPVNLMVMGNHDIYGGDEWAMGVAKSKDPKDYKKLRLGSHNLSHEMERIWGEPHDSVWHKTVKGYHFFGFDWPRFTGEDMNEAFPYEGRLDPSKPFFTATHALWFAMAIINGAMRQSLGLKDGELCNGLGLCGHGHGSNAHFGFNWWGDSLCYPYLMCSTLAYWKGHGGEGENPLFAKGFGSGEIDVKDPDVQKADHALLIKVYDDMMTVGRIWVNVLPKPVLGSLGPDWVMPLNWGTGNGERGMNDHPLKVKNYAKVIGSPEFPKGAKLEVKLEKIVGVGERNYSALELQLETPTVLRIKIPKADGNPDSRVYGYNVVVAGEDGTKVRKNCYARGYCMGVGHEPNNGITEVEIPQSELPAGKRLTIAVRPCSSLATRGKPITTTWRT